MVAFKIDFSGMSSKQLKEYESSQDSETNFKHLQCFEEVGDDDRLVKPAKVYWHIGIIDYLQLFNLQK